MSEPTILVSITHNESDILCEAVFIWLEANGKTKTPMVKLGKKLLKRLEELTYD